jgi:outer membrane PBP1 activator LpoA protein
VNPSVLALNTLPAGRVAPSGLYQFALAPEDEARAVARRMLQLGQKRGIVLIPTGDWGDRVNAAFTQELIAGGGTVLAEHGYDPQGHDFGTEVKAALRTDESETRHKRFETLLNIKMNFEPRRRADLDFIFAPGTSQTARLMRPQLRFYYAGEVPTYMTSDAFDPDAGTGNQDLDGVYFPDMPWMLGGDGSVDAMRQQISQQWEGRAAWKSRLFAFGFDACQLALSLPAAQRNPQALQISGLTGKLSLDTQGQVHRELGWAQMRGGMPKRMDGDGT